MFSNWLSRENRITGINYNHILYVCVLLACLVPRYISDLKVHVGINISFYTIFVVAVCLLTVRGFTMVRKVEYWFFLVWAALIVISAYRAEMIGVWLYYLDWIVTALLFQQILLNHWDEDSPAYLIRGMTDGLFIHILIGLYEVINDTYIFETGNISANLYGKVAISMFHNLNDYATFVITVLPFAVYRFVKCQSIIEKIYTAFISAASVYFIYSSDSRGAWLAFIIIFMALMASIVKKWPKFVLAIIVGMAVFVLLISMNFVGSRTWLMNYINSATAGSADSDNARINLIKNGLYFLGLTNGFGVGAGNLYKWLSERSIYYIGKLAFIHNWYVEILVTFGVAFFILYVIFHVKILYKLWSDSFGNSMVKTAFFISFAGFSVVSISSSSNVYSEWVWMYLILLSTFVCQLEPENDRYSYLMNSGLASGNV